MKLDKCFKLKRGDKIVHVRTYFKCFGDHSLVPIEPRIYTIGGKCLSGTILNEFVPKGFYMDSKWSIQPQYFDNRCLSELFETFEDYINGNYNKDIILDPKWESLEEFLEFKCEYDYQEAIQNENARKNKIKENN